MKPVLFPCLGLLAVVAAWAPAGEAMAATDPCPASLQVRPRVNVQKIFANPVLDRSKTLKQVNQMVGDHQHMGDMVLGLTNAKSVVGVQIKLLYHEVGGGVCAAASEVNVRVGYIEHTVWIPSKYPPGGCEYSRVYRHEMDHVNARRIEMDGRFAGVRRAIERAVNNIAGPKAYATTAVARDAMVGYISKAAEHAMAAVDAAAEVRDKKIDDPKAVQRDQRQCHNW